MIPEEEFFLEWDKEWYANIQEYAAEQNFDLSGYEMYIPEGVQA